MNRGIRIGESAGVFSVASGTTLTVDVPVSRPNTAGNVVAGILGKEGGGTLIFTNANNTHNGEMTITAGTLTVGGGGRLNSGAHAMPIVNNAAFLYDSTADQTLSGAMSGTGTLTLSGANTFTGSVVVNGGTLYANAANAANNRALSHVSGITVNSGGTLRASTNALFGWDGTQEKTITVNAGATLLANGGATGDVGVGTVTLAGGTLASTAASAAFGSWRFDEATDKLLVTQDSTASATNVKFGNAAAAIEIAAGRTLHFSGTITNATSGGTSYLTKTGAGTLTLAGANTHTGATSVNAGTLLVNGSLTASATTVASGATLGGTGTAGNVIVQSGGTLAPGTSAGTFTTAVTTLTGTLAIEIASAASADRVNASGAVTLGGPLTVNAPAGLPAGTTFTILNKTSAGAVSGTFTGKPQDSVFSASGNAWVISYIGGDGNDITLSIATQQQLWRFTWFSTAANTGPAADTFDADGDGELNLMEFATAQNPNAATRTATPLVQNAATLEFTYTRSDAAMADGVTFTVEWRDDLATGAWSSAGVTEQILTDNGTVQTIRASLPAGPGPQRFARLKVTGP